MSKVNTEKTTGDLIQKIIKSKGITKRAVSEKSGMPYSSLNSKLKGYRSFTIDDIFAIAEALDEPPAKLCPPEFFSKKDAVCGSEGHSPTVPALADTNHSKEMES